MVILMGGLFGPKFKEKETGPGAVTYWEDKDKSRQRSSTEKKEFMKQLDTKIDKYIAQNPQLSEEIKEQLKVFHTVYIGMTKEQVLLLLDEPAKKETVSDYGADEKWVYITYHPYAEDHLYFKDDTVIKILGFQTGNVL
jgi:hypothetical protein